MKIYDLSQPLNEQVSFWPFYPPFEVKYIKRKAEHGVNAQYIMTSNHMGTHLDAPRHFVTGGMTIDQIPVEWLCGPGVIVKPGSPPVPVDPEPFLEWRALDRGLQQRLVAEALTRIGEKVDDQKLREQVAAVAKAVAKKAERLR